MNTSHKRSFLVAIAVAIPAMLIGSGLSAPSAQAAYTVTLEEVGTSVVATGSGGTLDLTDLVRLATSVSGQARIAPSAGLILIGPTSSTPTDVYGSLTGGVSGPMSFGTGSNNTLADIGSGGIVGAFIGSEIEVPAGYVSGSVLMMSSATWNGATFASLGVTPGTYVTTWGTGADADSFTLQIEAVPAPVIGRGLPVLLAVGGMLFGAKLLERGKRRRRQFG